MSGKTRIGHKIVVGKPDGKRRVIDDMKMDLRERAYSNEKDHTYYTYLFYLSVYLQFMLLPLLRP
jgi:hypothetical protein